MANICCTRYAVEGSKNNLEKIASAINNSGNDTQSALKELGINYKDCNWKFLNRSEWSDAYVEEIDDTAVLFFSELYSWMRPDIIEYTIEKMSGSSNNIYYLVERFEDDIFYTNDVDGKYFPERVRFCSELTEEEWHFNNEEIAITKICQFYHISDVINNIDELRRWLDEHNISYTLTEIEVISNDEFNFYEAEPVITYDKTNSKYITIQLKDL